jgi:hypothetical protein
MPTWTISDEQVKKATERLEEGGSKLIVKNCIVKKFTPKEPNKDGEQITTITIDVVNLQNKEIAELSNYLGREVDMQLAESIEDRNGQQGMNLPA